MSHHTRPGECEVDSDPPPPANNINSALDNSDDHSVTTPAVADVNNSTLNTSEEIGTTADLEDCDIHSEQGEWVLILDCTALVRRQRQAAGMCIVSQLWVN